MLIVTHRFGTQRSAGGAGACGERHSALNFSLITLRTVGQPCSDARCGQDRTPSIRCTAGEISPLVNSVSADPNIQPRRPRDRPHWKTASTISYIRTRNGPAYRVFTEENRGGLNSDGVGHDSRRNHLPWQREPGRFHPPSARYGRVQGRWFLPAERIRHRPPAASAQGALWIPPKGPWRTQLRSTPTS